MLERQGSNIDSHGVGVLGTDLSPTNKQRLKSNKKGKNRASLRWEKPTKTNKVLVNKKTIVRNRDKLLVTTFSSDRSKHSDTL
jgi:hypothetical protein